jgi:hypothetical protein
MNKVFRVTLTFVTKDGVGITRTVALRDQYRASAEARAKDIALPPGARNVTAKAVRA